MQTHIIKCAFCKGTGDNPHYKGTCPACKGKGSHQIIGKSMACRDCHGSGRKGGTTLTCYTCTGTGVVPDVREELKQARNAIGKAWAMIEQERAQL